MRVYVALLEKIGALCSGCFEECAVPAADRETWITLGHFDAMHTYELDLKDKNLFQAIHQNNTQISRVQRGDRYFYPLYLLSPEDFAPFWKDAPPFLAVAKLHFSESVNINQAYSGLLKDLKDHEKKHGCTCRAFRTIELSDMILAVTADRLDRLLNFTLTLRAYSSVGKVYTYAGINYQAIRGGTWQPEPEDRIELFSMRFSVKDFRLAEDTVAQVEDILDPGPAYSVSGVDDIVSNWRGLATGELVKLYRTYFLSGKNLPWDRCFAEVTSRVGILLEKVDGREQSEKTRDEDLTRLQKSCDALLLRCGGIREAIREQGAAYNWSEPLFELVNTLARISRIAVLDEFVYIMYAGVDAFLQNVERCLHRLGEEDLSQYQAFVENWAHLMEHIIRIEGQLTHNPELRPILYDIPVAMLEYTLSFLKEITDVLQAADEPNRAEICFLLVPRLCDRIKAEELFSASADGLPGLVLVTIPVQSLYDARTVQRALCHEVSHFAGEQSRNREDRKKKYIQSAAALMSKVFFGGGYSAFIEEIQDRLMREFGGTSRLDMDTMRRNVLRWAGRLVEDQTVYFDFIRSVLQKSRAAAPLKLTPHDVKLDPIKRAHFSALLRDLSILFREIYADVCMLYLLPIDEMEYYIESLVQELITERRKEDRRYEQFAIRIYVSLTASGRNIPWEYVRGKDENLYREIQEIQQGLRADLEPEGRLFPLASVYFLLRYAEGCFESLCRQPQEKLQEVREMFRNVVAPDFNYERFLEDINQYRLRLLNS